MVRWLRTVLLVALALAIAPVAPASDHEITPRERYELGLKFMRRGYYTKALEQFNRVRNYHRDDPVSVLAELAIADLYYKKGEYEMARLSYEDFTRLHPRHEEMDYVTYRLGLSIDKRAPKLAGRDQTPTQQAVNTWTGFSSRYPESEYGEEVERLLVHSRDRLAVKELYIAKFYARRDAWKATRKRTERLLRKYPDSRWVPDAIALRGEALFEWGLVDDAREARETLFAQAPDSPALRRLDRVLAGPPGSPPEDEVFLRPYRISGGLGFGAPVQ